METQLKPYFFSKKNINSLIKILKECVSKDPNLNKHLFPDLEMHFYKLCELTYNNNMDTKELKVLNSLTLNNMLELIFQFQQQKDKEVQTMLSNIYEVPDYQEKAPLKKVEEKETNTNFESKEPRIIETFLVPLNHNNKSISNVKSLKIEKLFLSPMHNIYSKKIDDEGAIGNCDLSFIIGETTHNVCVKPGFYTDCNFLLNAIKEEILKVSGLFRICIEDNIITISLEENKWCPIYSPLWEILGFSDKSYSHQTSFVADKIFYICEPRFYMSCEDLNNIKILGSDKPSFFSIFETFSEIELTFETPKTIALNFDLKIRKGGVPVVFKNEIPNIQIKIEYF
jgi:hypothetical protein